MTKSMIDDPRQNGVLRTVLRALIGDDPDAAPIGDEQGGCIFCCASPPQSPLGTPRENDHAPGCPFRVGHQALRATTDPDWVTGLREDEAHQVVAMARELADINDMVDWPLFHRRLEARRHEHAGWDGLVRALEDDRLVELSAQAGNSGQRFAVHRLVALLNGAAA